MRRFERFKIVNHFAMDSVDSKKSFVFPINKFYSHGINHSMSYFVSISVINSV